MTRRSLPLPGCRALFAVALVVAFQAAAGSAAGAGVIWVHLCGSYTPGGGGTGSSIGVAHSGSGSRSISVGYQCPPGLELSGLEILADGSGVPAGTRAYWEVDAPPSFAIIGAHTEGQGMITYGVNQNFGWGGGFYWKGGGTQVAPSQVAYGSPAILSPYFGWQVVCGLTTCDGSSKPGQISVLGLEVEAATNIGPTVTPTPGTLGATAGWVRGRWPISFVADGPTGACQLNATLAGMSVSQTVNEPQNQASWHQCPAGWFAQMVDTASVGSGTVPVSMWARDAAYDYGAGHYLSSTVMRWANVDNTPVSLNLSGPTDAASTAGTQYITASAGAGPSGVGGIFCSVDGSPYQFHGGASEQIPVQGLGPHIAKCFAQNNALDTSGQPARSALQIWNLSIRVPSVSAVSFVHIVNALRCTKKRERVRVPSRWVTVRYRGHPQKVKLPAETRTIRVVQCHPRIIRQRVREHGRWRVRRVVVLPRATGSLIKHIPHGTSTTISGWLGTAQGNALGDQHVTILAAPDNGSGAYAPTAVTTTAPNGSWTATLPSGPSRLVRAAYGGASTVEPSSSGDAHVVVPASVTLSISPRRTHWGRTIRINGRLKGGYIPAAGEVVVLWIGWPGGSTEIGHLYANQDGRFASTYTFLRGNGRETYHLWAATARESDYPYAPGRSRFTTVSVSP